MGWGITGTIQGYAILSFLEKQNFLTRMLDFRIFNMPDFGHVPGYVGVGIWAESRNFDRIFSSESHFQLIWVPTAVKMFSVDQILGFRPDFGLSEI